MTATLAAVAVFCAALWAVAGRDGLPPIRNTRKESDRDPRR